MDVTIRKATPEDAASVHYLVKDVFNEFVAPGYSDEGINTFFDYIRPENIIESYKNNHFSLVAALQDDIIGVIHIRDFEHISLMFVDKKYHRRGIAGRLFYRALEICNKEKAQTVEITVNSSPYAVPVYGKLGFCVAGGEEIKNGIRYVPMKMTIKEHRLKKRVE